MKSAVGPLTAHSSPATTTQLVTMTAVTRKMWQCTVIFPVPPPIPTQVPPPTPTQRQLHQQALDVRMSWR